MGFGIGLGIGFGSRRAAAGAAGVALAISDLVIDTVSSPNRITIAATKSGTIYWVVTASATTPSATQIIAGQTHTGATASLADSFAVILGETVDNPDFTTLAAGTWYLHCVMTAGAETSNTLTSASFTIAASFTAAWQQFDGSAWLEKNSDMTGMPTNSAGFLFAATYSPSAGDIGQSRELFIPVSTANRLLIVKMASDGIDARVENASDVQTWVISTGYSTFVAGTKYLILVSLDPASAGLKAVVINLATHSVVISGSAAGTGTIGGPSASGWVIAAATGTGTRATSGQMERVMFWANTYADAGDSAVQGYFHDLGVLKDPSVAVAAIGVTPHINISGTALQTGANSGSGGAFAKDGAGTIIPA